MTSFHCRLIDHILAIFTFDDGRLKIFHSSCKVEPRCIETYKMSNPPFQRLLSFFAPRSGQANGQTIYFMDSLRGDLSLGLNFPIALFLAVTRHIIFRTSGFAIYIPSVKSGRQLLGGPGAFPVDETRRYSIGELLSLAGEGQKGGLIAQGDAIGLWSLAADTKDGKISGKEVRLFQKGEIMERIAERRRGRSDVLPFWRGGPLL